MAISIDDFIKAQEEAKSYLNKFDLAVKEFNDTGNWMGIKHGVGITEGVAEKNILAEEISSNQVLKDFFSQENFGQKISERRSVLEKNIQTAGFRAERKQMRAAQNVTDVEDIPQAEWERLVAKNNELKILEREDPVAYAKLFHQYNVEVPGTGHKLRYIAHSGAPELQGGYLGPSFTKGVDEAGERLSGNTKDLNFGALNRAQERLSGKEKYLEQLKSIDPQSTDALNYGGVEGIKDAIAKVSKDIQDTKIRINLSGKNADFMSATEAYVDNSTSGYFGRADWGNKSLNKTIAEAGDISESTGGRGTRWLIRGVEDITVSPLGELRS